MSCNCGNSCNQPCNCLNCCNESCDCNNGGNNPCNYCTSDYINGLNQQYLELDAQYNANSNAAIAANNALIQAMQSIVNIDNQQNCIVNDIEQCAAKYDSCARNLIKQLNCKSGELGNIYRAILNNAQQNAQLLNQIVQLGEEYNSILAELVARLSSNSCNSCNNCSSYNNFN